MRKKPKAALRVVVDTNVIVSGLLVADSYPGWVVEGWIAGRAFQPIVSEELIAEVNEVLRRPKIAIRLARNRSQLKVLLGILVNKAMIIKPRRLNDGLFCDSKDHFLLELAVTAKATTIVSGDSGIVALSGHDEILFQTPEEFCRDYALSSISRPR